MCSTARSTCRRRSCPATRAPGWSRRGRGREGLAAGDHVALSWAPYCGRCEECLRDLPHLCGTAWPLMLAAACWTAPPGSDSAGRQVHHYCFLSSFAERAVVPARSCVRIPADVPFEVAALLGCAVTSGVGAVWRTAGVRPGDRVAVFGLGGTGLSAVLGAVAAGASEVIAVDRRPSASRRPAAGRQPRSCSVQGEPARWPRRWRRQRRRRRLRHRVHRPARSDAGRLPLHPQAGRGRDGRDPARRRRADGARAVDSAHGAAGAGIDLRVGAARPRLPADPRRLPPRTAAARPADLTPAAAGRCRRRRRRRALRRRHAGGARPRERAWARPQPAAACAAPCATRCAGRCATSSICHCVECRRWHGTLRGPRRGARTIWSDRTARACAGSPAPRATRTRAVASAGGADPACSGMRLGAHHVAIAAGTLDGETGLRIVCHIYTATKGD